MLDMLRKRIDEDEKEGLMIGVVNTVKVKNHQVLTLSYWEKW